MKLFWFGHACFLLDTGSHRLLFDPWLNTNPLSPVQASEIECDYIFCSHAHDDHIADALEIAQRNKAVLIAPFELAEYFASQGAETLDPMPGGALTLPFGRVYVTPAIHSSSLDLGGGKSVSMGNPVGFVVAAKDRKIYHAGDTGLFSDMQWIGRHGLDVAMIPIGGHYTMGIDDAVDALDFLVPRLAVPMHFNTSEKIAADPRVFETQASARGHTVRILAPGDCLDF